MILTGFAGPGFARDAGSLKIPFAFVENKGQAKPDIRYIGNGPEFKAWFRDRGFSLQRGGALIDIRFAGGLAQPRMEASDELGATTNYVRGADPRGWQTNLPMFQRLVYRDVWP
ncbi:MAG TPA: hypothetical protein VHB50_15485, partial [Bryobacteraceae bacterium]|nr:hypothetical protein [Bryobacteraceae bacterium]